MEITRATSLKELAVIVSSTLEAAGISAVLSGGAAVSIYSENAYESADLDFVTSEGKKALISALQVIGFSPSDSSRMFVHSESLWFVEFPPGPLGFGDTFVSNDEIPLLNTPYGELRIITPTLSVIDRPAAYWYHFDRQCWDQAIEVAKRHPIDWVYVNKWASSERQSLEDVDKLRNQSEQSF